MELEYIVDNFDFSLGFACFCYKEKNNVVLSEELEYSALEKLRNEFAKRMRTIKEGDIIKVSICSKCRKRLANWKPKME